MSTLTLKDHRFQEIDFNLTPNTSGKFRAPPKYIVMHYTASTSAKSSTNWLTQKAAKASAHLVVGDNEKNTFQLCPFDTVAWHAGKSYYQGINGLNHYAIGIEVVNGGILTQGVDRKWRTWSGQVIDESRVLVAPHKRGGPVRGWMSYSVEQIEWLEVITTALLSHYPSIKEIIGHDDISWPRKTDPGPAFPMGRFQSLLGRKEEPAPVKTQDFTVSDVTDEDELFVVNTAVLNIRGGPGTSFEKIVAYGPLKSGQLLEVIDQEDDGWSFVELVGGSYAGNRGYVYNKFIKRV